MSDIATVLDPKILQALAGVQDPELGVGIVELGLVYRAERTSAGINVEVTLTTRNCPLGDFILDQIKDAIRDRFGTEPAAATLVWEPRWRPEMAAAAKSKLEA
ncbi:MAG: metal-sulfur cluster assembly factor [Alsobacter sp.]